MKKIIAILAVALCISSCDSYLDINQDPNSPSEGAITASGIFPGVEMNLANSYGNFLRITSGYYAQYYAQLFGTSNYLDFSQFTMSATRSSGTYSALNGRCLSNLKTIRELSSASEDWGTYLAATTLHVFIYQVLVDAYGEVPYSEGLEGLNNPAPKYDEGIKVYEGILGELDEALAKLDEAGGVSDNFLFGNDLESWARFAYAVKLKVLMRMSDVKDVKAELAALIEEDFFPKNDVAFEGCWIDEVGKANPFYQEEFASYFGSTQKNIVLNLALLGTMSASDDNRLTVFFDENSNGAYEGAISGTNFSTTKLYKSGYWCRPKATATMPVYLMTTAEVNFFLAEYYARYGTSAEAGEYYEAAVEASFETAGVDGAEDVLAAYPWDNANYKKIIGIQKWVALSGVNPFEGWCELRRLKYPAFGTVKGTDIYNESTDAYAPGKYVPGTLYDPIKRNTELEANKVLQRFRYAENSANRNPNVPATKGDGVPVFWAE